MDLSIIIVSYNVKNLLAECVKSLLRLKDKLAKEIIVVDNGSNDDSVAEIKKLGIKNLKIIENKKNLGFAKAVNQGIKASSGNYLLLLNPDTQVKDDSLKKMIDFAKNHHQAGVVGARLVNPDGSIQPSVYHFPSLKGAIREFWLGKKGAYDKYAPNAKKAIKVDAITGAVMLIPQQTIKRVGLFDERYFMYFEDLDFCRRIKKAGLGVYYLPQAEILHHHGQSAAKVGGKAQKWLVESSKIYNGKVKYWLLTFVIAGGQKWRKILGKKQ